jgi:hypothetical protein
VSGPPLSACRHQYPGGDQWILFARTLHRCQRSPTVGRVGSCIGCFGACSVFTARYGLHDSPSRLKRPSTSEAPAASLPPLPLRLLPGGANQFPGGTLNPRWTSALTRRTDRRKLNFSLLASVHYLLRVLWRDKKRNYADFLVYGHNYHVLKQNNSGLCFVNHQHVDVIVGRYRGNMNVNTDSAHSGWNFDSREISDCRT